MPPKSKQKDKPTWDEHSYGIGVRHRRMGNQLSDSPPGVFGRWRRASYAAGYADEDQRILKMAEYPMEPK